MLNIRHTVRGYEAAGVAAIQLEDREFPKKCGYALGRRVVLMGFGDVWEFEKRRGKAQEE